MSLRNQQKKILVKIFYLDSEKSNPNSNYFRCLKKIKCNSLVNMALVFPVTLTSHCNFPHYSFILTFFSHISDEFCFILWGQPQTGLGLYHYRRNSRVLSHSISLLDIRGNHCLAWLMLQLDWQPYKNYKELRRESSGLEEGKLVKQG